MVTVQVSVHISRPVSEVFGYIVQCPITRAGVDRPPC